MPLREKLRRHWLGKNPAGLSPIPIQDKVRDSTSSTSTAPVAEEQSQNTANGTAEQDTGKNPSGARQLNVGGSDLWQRAEREFSSDSTGAKIYEAYLEIIRSNFNSPEDSPPTASQRQLSGILNGKVHELQGQGFQIRLSAEHSLDVRGLFLTTSKKILEVRDLINGAASTCPPAALACAGILLFIALFSSATEQRQILLQGLDRVSTLVCQFSVFESVYRKRAKIPTIPIQEALFFEEKLESSLARLYGLIFEFHARALCYVYQHAVTRVFNDFFHRNSWEQLLSDMQIAETQCKAFKEVIDGERLHRGLDEQRQHFEKIIKEMQQSDEKAGLTDEAKLNLCLGKLHTCPYKDRKNRNRERVKDTCEWFTNHPLFTNWKDQDGPGLLLVSADPGCGKSVLARYLVDEVLKSNDDTPWTTCYFFFKEEFTDQRYAASALCAFIRQLLEQNPRLMNLLLYRQLMPADQKLSGSFDGLWDTFKSMISNPEAGQVICVIDALDECDNDDRARLTKAICNFMTSSALPLKLLITSRPYDFMLRAFKGWGQDAPIIRLSGEDEVEVEKIVHEIDLVIRSQVQDITVKLDLETDESDYLLDQLLSIPHRTYLWVTLTLEVIENMSGFTRGNVRKQIKILPRSVDEAYERILERSRDIKKTRRLLHIVIESRRPLSLTELQLAMSIEQHHTAYEEIELEQEREQRFRNTIRDLCGLFIAIVGSKVYLLHQTAREFLISGGADLATDDVIDTHFHWRHSVRMMDSNQILGEICVWYLNLFDSGDCPSTFLKYAAAHWQSHFRQSGFRREDDLTKRAARLCNHKSRSLNAWISEYHNVLDYVSYVEPLSVASCLGLEPVVELLLSEGAVANAMDIFNRTALWFAASRGHANVVKLLLLHNADPNVKGKLGQTPLFTAIENSDESIVKLLLDGGAMSDCVDDTEHIGLVEAARKEQTAIMRLLLANGADPNSRDTNGNTALLHSALNESQLDLLLKNGADINLKHKGGRSLLSCAVSEDWVSGQDIQRLVNTLISKGANVDAQDDTGRTALFWAVDKGKQDSVIQLINAGAAVDNGDHNETTPLSWAARKNNTSVISTLLSAHAKLDLRDKHGRTPLSWAAGSGQESVVKQLIKAGAEIDAADNFGTTPLWWTVYGTWSYSQGMNVSLGGREAIVDILLSQGADMDIKDKDGHGASWWASKNGYDSIAGMLKRHATDKRDKKSGNVDGMPDEDDTRSEEFVDALEEIQDDPESFIKVDEG